MKSWYVCAFIFGDCGGRQKESDAAVFIMGCDPVELAKRAKQKPPAMQVRGDGYTIMLNWIDISKCADMCINTDLQWLLQSHSLV